MWILFKHLREGSCTNPSRSPPSTAHCQKPIPRTISFSILNTARHHCRCCMQTYVCMCVREVIFSTSCPALLLGLSGSGHHLSHAVYCCCCLVFVCSPICNGQICFLEYLHDNMFLQSLWSGFWPGAAVCSVEVVANRAQSNPHLSFFTYLQRTHEAIAYIIYKINIIKGSVHPN